MLLQNESCYLRFSIHRPHYLENFHLRIVPQPGNHYQLLLVCYKKQLYIILGLVYRSPISPTDTFSNPHLTTLSYLYEITNKKKNVLHDLRFHDLRPLISICFIFQSFLQDFWLLSLLPTTCSQFI